jgi:hypothetical protein
VVHGAVDGQFAGVAAADVLVSSWERQLWPALRTLSRPAVLLNSQARSRGRPVIDWHPLPASGLG